MAFCTKFHPQEKGTYNFGAGSSPLILEDSIVIGFSDGAVLRLSKSDGTF